VVDRVSSIAGGMPGRPFSGWRCCDEDRKEHVFAFPEGVGFGIASLDASSEEAQALREALYQIRRKQKIVTIEGVEYRLRARIHQSFEEDVFRVTIQKG